MMTDLMLGLMLLFRRSANCTGSNLEVIISLKLKWGPWNTFRVRSVQAERWWLQKARLIFHRIFFLHLCIACRSVASSFFQQCEVARMQRSGSRCFCISSLLCYLSYQACFRRDRKAPLHRCTVESCQVRRI